MAEDGDKEGVSFIPRTLAQSILDKTDETNIHDDWNKLKFVGGNRSTDIYPSPIARKSSQAISGIPEEEISRIEGFPRR